MIDVRLPDGTILRYNTAKNAYVEDGVVKLVDLEDAWIVQISAAMPCIVEAIPPCKIIRPRKRR